MKVTKRQLRRIIKEEKLKLLREQHATSLTPDAWANKHRGDVDRDEEGQTIIYLSKEDYPSDRDVASLLPPGWDYEDTYDETSWVIYTGLYQ